MERTVLVHSSVFSTIYPNMLVVLCSGPTAQRARFVVIWKVYWCIIFLPIAWWLKVIGHAILWCIQCLPGSTVLTFVFHLCSPEYPQITEAGTQCLKGQHSHARQWNTPETAAWTQHGNWNKCALVASINTKSKAGKTNQHLHKLTHCWKRQNSTKTLATHHPTVRESPKAQKWQNHYLITTLQWGKAWRHQSGRTTNPLKRWNKQKLVKLEENFQEKFSLEMFKM